MVVGDGVVRDGVVVSPVDGDAAALVGVEACIELNLVAVHHGVPGVAEPEAPVAVIAEVVFENIAV